MSNIKQKKVISALKGNLSRHPRSVVMSKLVRKNRPGRLNQYINNLYIPNGDLRTNKKLWEVLPSNILKGRRVFIVGGGTSLRGFDFSQLQGEIVVTVNRTFESFPDSIFNVCQDARLWGWYENKELPEGDEARLRFLEYKGYKVWLNVQAFPFPEDVYQVDILHPDDFNWKNPTLSAGIPPYGNSGLNALNMVIGLGAREIYLLGFDMYGEGGRTANYHSGYPDSNSEEVYKDSFIPNFKDFAERIKGLNAKIVNLNPNSALKCFGFGRFEDIPKINRPVVVSFYTKGTGYEIEKNRLDASARRFGITVDFYEQEDQGSWRANIHDRIRILRNFLDKHQGRDVLYIDCDAAIVQYPELFDNFDKGDLGIYKLDRSKYFRNWKETWNGRQYEYLGGTMYFKNNARIRALLDLWERLDKSMETPLSQMTLFEAIQSKLRAKELDIYEIPATYCQIYDIMADAGDPVIEHFQASRRGLHSVKIDDKTGKFYLNFGGVRIEN